MIQKRNHKENGKKNYEKNENENTTQQNLWYTAKAKLRRLSVTINTNVRKDERCQLKNFSVHVKKLKKKRANQNQPRRRKE